MYRVAHLRSKRMPLFPHLLFQTPEPILAHMQLMLQPGAFALCRLQPVSCNRLCLFPDVHLYYSAQLLLERAVVRLRGIGSVIDASSFQH